ncbi:MAG: cobalamin-binding protein [Lachnospiraceae bacterium]|nr:cobalamin-binding protein [Lachnospiraceae bacterium]
MEKQLTFGMLKSLLDAHTMGVHAASALLSDCGYKVIIAPTQIEDAVSRIASETSQKLLLDWIRTNNITNLGISYRLDPDDAVQLVGRIVYLLKKNGLYESSDSIVKSIHFAGLKPACDKVEREYAGRIKTFRGGESAEETLLVMGVPADQIPKTIKEGCQYDKDLLKFGREIIQKNEYENQKPLTRNLYPEFGTANDSLELRLKHNFKEGFQPLIRSHSGPYSSEMTRQQCLKQYWDWCKDLANAGFLDILSIGSSQLSQSNFGESWEGKPNGGGVPVNSEEEYHTIWQAARPMLVRTYSATKDVAKNAAVFERSINICWHALSLWWFNELDGRGPNSLYPNIIEHIDAIRYSAATNKPFEANVPHHFAFRGCDDVTYIVSGFLAAKLAKKLGIKTFVLQNMLNTPRSTWGIQDLAKSRVLLKLIKELEDSSFKVILQTRAGLDYFKPDIEEAKVQLAAVTAMMDDIDPFNTYSPDIIHVVSYSEALYLATPDIINDSIKITRQALGEYRKLKQRHETPDVMTEEILSRTANLEKDCRAIIGAMEEIIPDLYSANGMYLAFVGGWLPVPELWSNSEEFRFAKGWGTKGVKGSIVLTDQNLSKHYSTKETDLIANAEHRIQHCASNMPEAIRMLHEK